MASIRLEQIAGGTWYIPGPVNVGIHETQGSVTLIDSGGDEEAGKRILKLVTERGWKLDLIVNTHSNADHIGGNRFLQEKTGCRIAATSAEAAFIENPDLEPSFLYGGFPVPPMRGKFLRAQPSTVTDIISPECAVLATGLTAFPLPGHFFAMIGVRTPDNVAFIADSLFPPRILEKYHVTFLYDVAAQLRTLDALAVLRADWFLPSHGDLARDIGDLIETNRDKCREIADFLSGECGTPRSADELLSALSARYGLTIDMVQFLLLGSTLRSYLSFLAEDGILSWGFYGGSLRWERAARPRHSFRTWRTSSS